MMPPDNIYSLILKVLCLCTSTNYEKYATDPIAASVDPCQYPWNKSIHSMKPKKTVWLLVAFVIDRKDVSVILVFNISSSLHICYFFNVLWQRGAKLLQLFFNHFAALSSNKNYKQVGKEWKHWRSSMYYWFYLVLNWFYLLGGMD